MKSSLATSENIAQWKWINWQDVHETKWCIGKSMLENPCCKMKSPETNISNQICRSYSRKKSTWLPPTKGPGTFLSPVVQGGNHPPARTTSSIVLAAIGLSSLARDCQISRYLNYPANLRLHQTEVAISRIFGRDYHPKISMDGLQNIPPFGKISSYLSGASSPDRRLAPCANAEQISWASFSRSSFKFRGRISSWWRRDL